MMKKLTPGESIKDMDRKAWATAQAMVTHDLDPQTKEKHIKKSWERFERLQSGETTIEDEEAVLLMQWRALNNLAKNQD